MKHPKQIARPQLADATVMTALDLNSVRFSNARTLLTPEQLQAPAAGGSSAESETDQTAVQS